MPPSRPLVLSRAAVRPKPETHFLRVAQRLRWRWNPQRTVAHARYAGASLWLWREAPGVLFGDWGIAVFRGRDEFVSFYHAMSSGRAKWKAVMQAMYFRDGQWPELD